jgi:hypothetical protein
MPQALHLNVSHLVHLYTRVLAQQKCKSATEQDMIADFMKASKIGAVIEEFSDSLGNIRAVREDEDKNCVVQTDLRTIKLLRKLCKQQIEEGGGVPFHLSEQHASLRATLETAVDSGERAESTEADNPSEGEGGKEEGAKPAQ